MPSSPIKPDLKEFAFVCHGCNIMLKEYTQEHSKIEYVGPGLCVPWWGVNFVQNMDISLYSDAA